MNNPTNPHHLEDDDADINLNDLLLIDSIRTTIDIQEVLPVDESYNLLDSLMDQILI